MGLTAWYAMEATVEAWEDENQNFVGTKLRRCILSLFCCIRLLWHRQSKYRVGRFGSLAVLAWGTVRAVPVFGSDGSSLERVFCSNCFNRKDMVPVSVPEKRFRRFRFLIRFLEKRFRRFWFPVPVRFLCHPANTPGQTTCKLRCSFATRFCSRGQLIEDEVDT